MFYAPEATAEFDYAQYLELDAFEQDGYGMQTIASQPSQATVRVQSQIALNNMSNPILGETIMAEDVFRLPTWDKEPWKEVFKIVSVQPHGKNVSSTRRLTSKIIDTPSPVSTESSPKSDQSNFSNIPHPEPFDILSNLGLDQNMTHQYRHAENKAEHGASAGSPETAIPGMTSDPGGHPRQLYEANSQLDLASLFGKLGNNQGAAMSLHNQFNYNEFLGFLPPKDSVSCLSVQPDDLTLKRKMSGVVDDGHETKRRDVTFTLESPFAIPAPLSNEPLLMSPSTDNEIFSDLASPEIKVSSSDNVKASTARPKSVVPEKFLNDGSAEVALGMTVNEIQSFPSFDELLKKVRPDNYTRAKTFGDKIANNRDKAKLAAKRSRDQRRAKIEKAEQLEKKTEELQMEVDEMKSLLGRLLDSGAISQEMVQGYL